ncbi:PKD domain-containing protein [Frankia sp. AgB1.9]|uniref:PKD domain-containing protein n=1 Tax=unclassified Frankia TaxID=2632575 RepID=UPI0019338FDC|nr:MULTISPECIES: PKD domain-containing protein [unclassified Frankia]MBL7488384.1 PKD domain-containing protein [Frankia sp. AgW1.1]MBL7547668.1 PKD domain-containing protein [Frankia sp. AgB1.9]MBL7624087.1 PKD domain-containing protein [Frankia sp. AgB1.8]
MALAVLIVGVTVVVVAVGRSRGEHARSVSLPEGEAWLVSSAAGQVSLIDGSTAQVLTQVSVSAAQLAGVQAGSDEFVTAGNGSLRRIDGATYGVSAPVRFSTHNQAPALYPAPGALFAVDPTTGLVTLADPRSLRVRGQFSLAARVADGAAVADSAGRLWAVDGRTGDLIRIGLGGEKIQRTAVDPARTRLVTVGGRPVAVDLAAGRARRIDTDGVTGTGVCLATGPGDSSLTVTGAALGSRLYVVSGARGLLLTSDLATGSCGLAVDLGTAGHLLGEPKEAAAHVFIPDFTAGTVIVFDEASTRVVARPKVLPPNTPFELENNGPVMFFNDPASSRAGIIDLTGAVRPVRKYDPTKVGPGAGSGAEGGGLGLTDTTSLTSSSPRTPPSAGPTATPTPSSQPSTNPRQTQPASAGASSPPRPGSSAGPSRPSIRQGLSLPGVEPRSTGDGIGTGVLPGGSGTGPSVLGSTGSTTVVGGSTTDDSPVPDVVIAASTTSTKIDTSVTLQAQANAAAGGVRAVTWTFGDGVTAAGTTVSHAWTSDGGYPVTATVQLVNGGTLVRSVTITVSKPGVGPPTAALTVSPNSGEAQLQVSASAAASAPGGAPISRYVFDFGDGTTAVSSSSPQAAHNYLVKGDYAVVVTVFDSTGVSSQASELVIVDEGIVPVLQVRPAGDNSLMITADGSQSRGGSGLTYRFDWGDRTAATLGAASTASHTYAAAGTYTMTLTVTDSAGRSSDNARATVTVPGSACSLEPTLTVSPGTVAPDQQVTAVVSLACTPTGTVSYAYDFGAGAGKEKPSASNSDTHVYPQSGNYYVSVTVTAGSESRMVTASVAVTSKVLPPMPVLRVSPASGIAPLTVTADASGTTGTDPITYSFSFGDGSAVTAHGSGRTASHTYSSPGTYTVTVTADNAGGPATASESVTVTGRPPVAYLVVTPAGGEAPLPVAMSAANSTAGDAPISSYTFIVAGPTGTQTYGPQTSSSFTQTLGAGSWELSVEVKADDGSSNTSRPVHLNVTAPTGSTGPVSTPPSSTPSTTVPPETEPPSSSPPPSVRPSTAPPPTPPVVASPTVQPAPAPAPATSTSTQAPRDGDVPNGTPEPGS